MNNKSGLFFVLFVTVMPFCELHAAADIMLFVNTVLSKDRRCLENS